MSIIKRKRALITQFRKICKDVNLPYLYCIPPDTTKSYLIYSHLSVTEFLENPFPSEFPLLLDCDGDYCIDNYSSAFATIEHTKTNTIIFVIYLFESTHKRK